MKSPFYNIEMPRLIPVHEGKCAIFLKKMIKQARKRVKCTKIYKKGEFL